MLLNLTRHYFLAATQRAKNDSVSTFSIIVVVKALVNDPFFAVHRTLHRSILTIMQMGHSFLILLWSLFASKLFECTLKLHEFKLLSNKFGGRFQNAVAATKWTLYLVLWIHEIHAVLAHQILTGLAFEWVNNNKLTNLTLKELLLQFLMISISRILKHYLRNRYPVCLNTLIVLIDEDFVLWRRNIL